MTKCQTAPLAGSEQAALLDAYEGLLSTAGDLLATSGLTEQLNAIFTEWLISKQTAGQLPSPGSIETYVRLLSGLFTLQRDVANIDYCRHQLQPAAPADNQIDHQSDSTQPHE